MTQSETYRDFDWQPNKGELPVAPESEVVLRFANGTMSATTIAGSWHWGMHRRMPGIIVAWAHASDLRAV